MKYLFIDESGDHNLLPEKPIGNEIDIRVINAKKMLIGSFTDLKKIGDPHPQFS